MESKPFLSSEKNRQESDYVYLEDKGTSTHSPPSTLQNAEGMPSPLNPSAFYYAQELKEQGTLKDTRSESPSDR